MLLGPVLGPVPVVALGLAPDVAPSALPVFTVVSVVVVRSFIIVVLVDGMGTALVDDEGCEERSDGIVVFCAIRVTIGPLVFGVSGAAIAKPTLPRIRKAAAVEVCRRLTIESLLLRLCAILACGGAPIRAPYAGDSSYP